MLAFVNASPGRQFEFVQSQWINDGDFISAGSEKDPIIGTNAGVGVYTYPAKPIRKHMVGLPSFVVTKRRRARLPAGHSGSQMACSSTLVIARAIAN